MAKTKTGWKVVVPYFDGYASCYRVAGRLRYYTDRFTYRQDGCGPLCVFDSLKSAQSYSKRWEFIFECEYSPSTDTEVWTPGSKVLGKTFFPEGTVLADKVRLTKKKG